MDHRHGRRDLLDAVHHAGDLVQHRAPTQARRSTFYAAALCLPLGIALALIGVAAKFLHPTMNSLYALPVFLQGMNPLLAGLVTTSLVASVFVSVSTVALAIASLIMRDFYVPLFPPGAGRGTAGDAVDLDR